ncbi:MAG: PCRF domain-containing protein [Candidatus Liptonbacteria bacterium]|nr:PCRF domain-containing protein [Candidatus Liptonbacteria bacterium]
MSAPGFWQNRISADEKIKRLGILRDLVTRYQEIETGIAALSAGGGSASGGEKSFDENLYYATRRKFRAFELEELFKGKYDGQAAIVSVYPGAGGEDAEDWARMLGEMYLRYAERMNWKARIVDENPRGRIVEIKGQYAYGYLKKESGVHRLVRISPFSPKKLRHTAFALVEVVPDLPPVEGSKVQIPEDDLKWEFSRAGGPGGQNVNKVETAVRVTHLPTGITVGARVERSQQQNREYALRLLKAKIIQLMERHHVEELSGLRVKAKPEWGNQIRSYVLNPYQLVKDHRTEVETSQVDKVLAGDLDMFVEAEAEKNF